MSFMGFGRPQPSSAEKMAAVEAEMEAVMEMSRRMSKICAKKCVPNDYREGDLNKGESVCLDRCAAKFFEVNAKVNEAMQAEAQRTGNGAGAAGSGGGFGFGGV